MDEERRTGGGGFPTELDEPRRDHTVGAAEIYCIHISTQY